MNADEGLATTKRQRAISVTFVSDNDIPNIIRNLSEIGIGKCKLTLNLQMCVSSH